MGIVLATLGCNVNRNYNSNLMNSLVMNPVKGVWCTTLCNVHVISCLPPGRVDLEVQGLITEGHRSCYAELAVFFPITVAITIASTHFAYPQKVDQAELAWVAWLNKYQDCTREWSPISVLTQLDV